MVWEVTLECTLLELTVPSHRQGLGSQRSHHRALHFPTRFSPTYRTEMWATSPASSPTKLDKSQNAFSHHCRLGLADLRDLLVRKFVETYYTKEHAEKIVDVLMHGEMIGNLSLRSDTFGGRIAAECQTRVSTKSHQRDQSFRPD